MLHNFPSFLSAPVTLSEGHGNLHAMKGLAEAYHCARISFQKFQQLIEKMYWLKKLRTHLTQKMGYLLTVPLAPSVVHVKRVTAVCIRLLTPFIRIIQHVYNVGFHSDCG